MSKGFPVLTGEQQAAAYYSDESSGVTTTTVRKSVPGGATSIELGLFSSTSTSASARFLYVAYGAISDSEEDYMLATPGLRDVIPLGEVKRVDFPESDPCLRYAIKTDAATESNGNLVTHTIGSLV